MSMNERGAKRKSRQDAGVDDKLRAQARWGADGPAVARFPNGREIIARASQIVKKIN